MISAKGSLTGHVNSKQSLIGTLNKAVEYVNPITQEKEVIPSSEIQIIYPDKGYTGLSKVKVYPSTGVNLLEYIDNVVSGSSYSTPGYIRIIKQLPNELIINTTNLDYMFYNSKLTKIPKMNLNSVVSMIGMFNNCEELLEVSELNTSNITRFYSLFNGCKNLIKISKLNANKINDLENCFARCYSLKILGGLENIGMAYDETKTSNYTKYKLDLSSSVNFTHESLINVINNLYDIATKGCNAQQLVLGSSNLAKLTSEEIAIATAKGWTIS